MFEYPIMKYLTLMAREDQQFDVNLISIAMKGKTI